MNGKTDDNSAQLETEFIFIDTEVFVREKFDWNSKSFTRLKELVRTGHLRVLTTSITKNEVMRKIREALDNAAKSVKKHEIILGQLGVPTATEKANASNAVTDLQSLLDQFLKDVRASEVPLSVNLDDLCDSYFQEKPPFSGKKKSEFPDAIVLSSLRDWSSQKGKKVYAVSGDQDFKASCGSEENLIHAESLADVISISTVTKRVQEDLLKFLDNSESLKSRLSEELRGSPVKVRGIHATAVEDITGNIDDVSDVSINHLNVISQDGTEFVCEIQVEADLALDLTIEMAWRYTGDEDYEPGPIHYETDSVWHYSYAEVVVNFDPENPSDAEIESIHFDPTIEIDASELGILRRF
jgi:predicted nucleic acid-binding protein